MKTQKLDEWWNDAETSEDTDILLCDKKEVEHTLREIISDLYLMAPDKSWDLEVQRKALILQLKTIVDRFYRRQNKTSIEK